MPAPAPAAPQAPAPQTVAMVASIPMGQAAQPDGKMNAVAEQPEAETVATREPLPEPE